MPSHHANVDSLRHTGSRWRACLLAMCMLAVFDTQARDAASHASSAKSLDRTTAPLSIKIFDDRMTVSMAGAAQVYLYGVIDADAPQRFAALVKSWKIPAGADVYLNATGDDLDAGMALGRLLREGSMSTHLGLPTRGPRSKVANKSSVCAGACAYAFLGGVYRWAPAGNDRFGIAPYHVADPKGANTDQARQVPGNIAAYLKDMGVAPAAFAAVLADSHSQMVWPAANQMLAAGLANNGHQPLVASYRVSAGVPRLELDQVGRRGEQRITLQCKPGSVSLTAYSKVGADRAQQIVQHATRSYFEIDRRETLSQPLGGASVDHDAVIIDRAYPPNQLGSLLAAKSVGAWVSQRNSTLSYGFVFQLEGIDRVLKAFYGSCWKYAPWSVKPSS